MQMKWHDMIFNRREEIRVILMTLGRRGVLGMTPL
jgi:hypothetical protein